MDFNVPSIKIHYYGFRFHIGSLRNCHLSKFGEVSEKKICNYITILKYSSICIYILMWDFLSPNNIFQKIEYIRYENPDIGVPVMAQRELIWLVSMRMQVRFLASPRSLRIQRCCELWCRSQMLLDLALLCLWCRPVATALIGPLAWEPP